MAVSAAKFDENRLCAATCHLRCLEFNSLVMSAAEAAAPLIEMRVSARMALHENGCLAALTCFGHRGGHARRSSRLDEASDLQASRLETGS